MYCEFDDKYILSVYLFTTQCHIRGEFFWGEFFVDEYIAHFIIYTQLRSKHIMKYW